MGAGELQFGLVQLFKRVAKMDEEQIALMAEERIDGAALMLHLVQNRYRLREKLLLLSPGEVAPGTPFEPHHLMENACALQSQRHRGERRGYGGIDR